MNAIEIKGVTKRYGGFTLDNVSLTLPEGMVMGLIGENGAGKSTLIRLLMGLSRPESGSISILGKDNREDFHLTKQDIGIVFDETGISPELNVHQVNKIMKDIYKNWDEEQFFGFVKSFELPEKKRFKTFSKGMKMKLGIAMALSHYARLLIMDEPTAGLDPFMRDEVIQQLFSFTRDESCSVLISSHIISDLERICDYIAFLHRGKLVLCEEKDRLYEEYGILQCSKEEFAALPPESIIGKNDTNYGLEVMVRRSAVPGEHKYNPADLEKLFVFIARREKNESITEI